MPNVQVWLTQDNYQRVNSYMLRRGTKNISKAISEMLYPLDKDTYLIVQKYIEYQEGLTGRPINFQVGINQLIRRYRFLKDENARLKKELDEIRHTSASTTSSTTSGTKLSSKTPKQDTNETTLTPTMEGNK